MKDKTNVQKWIKFENIVTKIQQMMDKNSVVTHNERLIDRVGNERQYDIVIRGNFGGRHILGVIECKDHCRKKGPSTIEAFAKKTENLGANLRIIVSRKGFTRQALSLAKHENIGCLSLLPNDPNQSGFSVGSICYGIIDIWSKLELIIEFAKKDDMNLIENFNLESVMYEGKKVINWFKRELFTTHKNKKMQNSDDIFMIKLDFDMPRNIEIEGKYYLVVSITCNAERLKLNKKKWIYWTGEAFFDWHTSQFTIPPSGSVVTNSIETDISKWDNYDGDIPNFDDNTQPGINFRFYQRQLWDDALNEDTPDLSNL